MIGLTSLEVYKSFFDKTEENIKFEFYTDTFDEFSFAELKHELEEILDISNIKPEHLQHEKLGPQFIEAFKKLESEKKRTDGYTMLLICYARSPFRDFESFLIIVVGLIEDDTQLIIKLYISNFVQYEKSPGIYTIKNLSKAFHNMGDHERTLKKEIDYTSMETKPTLTHFGGTVGTLRFDDKPFFITLLGFIPHWDYGPTNAIHADNPGF